MSRAFGLERTVTRTWVVLRTALVVAGMVFAGHARDAEAQETSTTAAREVPESLNFANGLFRSRQYALAAEEYERFLKTNPKGQDEVDALWGLANARQFLQQYAQARAAFESLLKAAPDSQRAPAALFRVGELAYTLGNLPEARSALERYTSRYPGDKYQELAWPYLGDVAYRQADWEAARRSYERSLEISPKGRWAERSRYYLGRTLSQLGDQAGAKRAYESLVSIGNSAFATEAKYQIGLIALDKGQFAEAEAVFGEVEKSSDAGGLAIKAKLGRADALVKLDRRDEAEALLLALLEDPTDATAARAAYSLGMSRLERGALAEARAAFETGLKRSGTGATTPALLYRSAEAANQAGERDEARRRFERIAREFQEDAWADEAIVNAARLSLEAKDYKAVDSLLELGAKLPASSATSARLAILGARAEMEQGTPQKAVERLESVISLADLPAEPKASARFYLALAYRATNQEDRARTLLAELAASGEGGYAADARYVEGQTHFEAGRFEQAISCFEMYLKDKANGDVADHSLAYLALSAAKLGRWDSSKSSLDQLLERYPKSDVLMPTIVRLGEIAIDAKEWDRASEWLRKSQPDLETEVGQRALLDLGLVEWNQGKFSEAEKDLERLLQSQPAPATLADAVTLRARCLAQMGRSDEALTALESFEKGESDATRVRPAQIARARLLVDSKRYSDAAELYRKALEGIAHDDSLGESVASELAWALLDAGRGDEAEAAFRRVMTEWPKTIQASEARLQLADTAFERKSYEEIETLLRPIITGEQDSTDEVKEHALYRLGRTQIERGLLSEAGVTFAQLTREFPKGQTTLESKFWSAEVAYQRQDAANAEKGFASVIEEAKLPGYEPVEWLPTAQLRRAQSLVMLERWAEALELAKAMIADQVGEGSNAEIEFVRGRALQGLARFDEARDAFSGVISARKGTDLAARAQFLRGETYFHQKDYREALREFLKVDILYRGSRQWRSLALLEIGKVYEQLGQRSEAFEAYQKVRENFPEEPAAEEASRGLDRIRPAERSTGSKPDPDRVRG